MRTDFTCLPAFPGLPILTISLHSSKSCSSITNCSKDFFFPHFSIFFLICSPFHSFFIIFAKYKISFLSLIFLTPMFLFQSVIARHKTLSRMLFFYLRLLFMILTFSFPPARHLQQTTLRGIQNNPLPRMLYSHFPFLPPVGLNTAHSFI